MRLPKLDTLIILVFFVCIALWMISRCEQKRSDYQQRAFRKQEPSEKTILQPDTIQRPPAPKNNPTPTENEPQNPNSKKTTTEPPKKTQEKTPTPTKSTSNSQATLYVTIDGLKLRKEPGLKGGTLAQLKLNEEVTFLGKRTDWTQEISLGTEKVTDRWVLVKTKSGKEGWVFGAGVHFYKEKRKGVLD
jgi:hypothetical protein